MTHRRSTAVLFCAACLLGSGAALRAQQSNGPVSITGSANVTSRNGSVTATTGTPTSRPSTPPRNRNDDPANVAARERNARLLRSRIPALRKAHALREWQAANADRERERQKNRKRRSR